MERVVHEASSYCLLCHERHCSSDDFVLLTWYEALNSGALPVQQVIRVQVCCSQQSYHYAGN